VVKDWLCTTVSVSKVCVPNNPNTLLERPLGALRSTLARLSSSREVLSSWFLRNPKRIIRFYDKVRRTMGRSPLFIFSYPLPVADVPLGALVAFMGNPIQDSFSPNKQLPTKPQAEYSTSEMNNVSKLLRASNGVGLELVLASFARLFFKFEFKDVRQLEAKQGTQYLLSAADDWFEEICQSDLTRTWLERAAMRGRKAYLVTGLQTLRDVDIDVDRSHTVGNGAGVQAPLLAAAGIPIPTSLDPGAKAEYFRERGVKDTASVPDEKIYGVQYREIKLRKRDSSKPVAVSLTSKIWWEEICSLRNAYDVDMDDNHEEIIDAYLLDGIDNLSETGVVSAAAEEEILLFEPAK